MASAGSGFARKLLRADISSECSIGILNFMRAMKNLEPWAWRLIDSSAKIPIGVFPRNLCRTWGVRRIANFKGYVTDERLPGFRLGICFISDCTARDLQEIVDTFVGAEVKVTVRNCVTNQDEEISNTQIWILGFLATIAVAIIAGTTFDVFFPRKIQGRHDCLVKCLTTFSLVKNTKYIFRLKRCGKSDTYVYGFVHGLRFFSIFWIVLGHSYGFGLHNSCKLVNAVQYFQHWHTVTVTFGYQAVDTFFFFSGFFLYFKLDKEHGNRFIVSIIAISRRLIRVTIPMFFMIMCMYILPLVASGPNSKEFYSRFYEEIRDHWWDLLLQPILPHLWYLSADFQLFLIGVIVIQAFKKKKWLVVWLFGALSFACCIVSAWQIYGTNIPPFLIAVNTTYRKYLDTLNKYYVRPFYHGVCFFSGCMTFLAIQKHLWYRSDGRASEPTRMAYAFIDRILWSMCVSWFVFACATCKAGPLSRFLSWEGMLPLSRLSFGVYLLHSPIQTLSYYVARERIFFSHYTLVSSCFSVLIWSYILSYLMFIACDGPTANLEALLLAGRRRARNECKDANTNGKTSGRQAIANVFRERSCVLSHHGLPLPVANGYRL
ncbi:hypothetical protein MRX96_004967 [Rhipicephalus microplus]